MGQVIRINQSSQFTLEETQRVLPIVQRITKQAVKEFLLLEEKLKACQHDAEKWQAVEEEIAQLLDHWSHKMMKLGCVPKGIWLVDFDNGEGYYCWRYGDEDILYFHGYHDGFSGRVAVNSI